MNELPDPLVPSHVDLRDFGFMPLEVLRLRDSELAVESSGDEFKAAVLLWCTAWHQVPAGSLPAKDALLADYSKAGVRWPKVKEQAMRGFVECSDGRLYHPVIAAKALQAWKEKVAQRARTAAATAAREAKRREQQAQRDVERNVQRDEDRNGPRDDERDVVRDVHQGTGTGTGTGTGNKVLHPSGVARQAAPRAAKKAPKDFAVDDAMRQWAREHAPHVDVDRETAKLRDHTFSTARVDWLGTWRNWLRKAEDDHPRNTAAPPAETAYQRSQRERVAQFAPRIAAEAPTAAPAAGGTIDVIARIVG